MELKPVLTTPKGVCNTFGTTQKNTTLIKNGLPAQEVLQVREPPFGWLFKRYGRSAK
jgi:hypothetical protein